MPIHRRPPREDERQSARRQTASLAALALLVALVVSSLILIRALDGRGRIEDCLLTGQRNCDAAVAAEANR